MESIWKRKEVGEIENVNELEQVDSEVKVFTGHVMYIKKNGELYEIDRYGQEKVLKMENVSEVVIDDTYYWKKTYYDMDENCHIYYEGYEGDVWKSEYVNIGKVRVKQTADGYYLTENGELYKYIYNGEDEKIDENVEKIDIDLYHGGRVKYYKKNDGTYKRLSGEPITRENPLVVDIIQWDNYEIVYYGEGTDLFCRKHGKMQILDHVLSIWRDEGRAYSLRTDGTIWDITGIPFQVSELYEESIIRGDVTGDKTVNIQDLRMVLRKVCGKVEFDEKQTKAGDVTGDGKVDLYDLRKILRFICKKIEAL